jgi:hypothetical protein
MRPVGLILIVAALAVGPLLTGVAHSDPRDRAVAEGLFQAGRDAAQRGDYAVACDKFRESNRLDPAVGTLFNLADCNEHLGKLATAWELFKEVAQRLPGNDDRVPIATGRASALEAQLPRLALGAPPSAPSGLVVLRDGTELGSASFDLPLPADPGEHVIVVRAPGRADNEIHVTLARGEKQHVPLALGSPLREASLSPAPTVDGTATSASRGRTTGYVVLGVGLVGIAASMVTGALALSEKGKVDDHCNAYPNRVCDSDDAYRAASRGRTMAAVSTVAFAAGAVGVGAGVYLIVSNRGTKSTALAASVRDDGAFVGLTGRF